MAGDNRQRIIVNVASRLKQRLGITQSQFRKESRVLDVVAHANRIKGAFKIEARPPQKQSPELSVALDRKFMKGREIRQMCASFPFAKADEFQ
jgi:hypothetical protein